jgi:type VI secretion system protein VasJ
MTLENLQEKAAAWLAPISAEAPVGTSARFDPRYESLLREMAKLESPIGGTIDWKGVIDQGSGLLQTASKDLLVAAHVAYGLYATQGLGGLALGAVLLAELCDRFWEPMFPELKRIRGRTNALAWFTERVCLGLPGTSVTAADAGAIEDLVVAGQRLGQVTRERFESNAPALGPLLEGIERLRLTLPPPEPPPPPPPAPEATPAAPAAEAGPAPAAPAGPAVAAIMPATPAGGDPTEFLRQVGAALAEVGATLRQAQGADPMAYRLRRMGLWLHLSSPPPATGGRTAIPAPPPALKTQLDKMSQNQRWAEVLEEAEASLEQYRLSLDLQRYSAVALAGLGPVHQAARKALVLEVEGLLRRMPTLVDLQYNDGSPLADPQTKAWIEEEVLAAPAGGGGGDGDGASEEDVQRVREARKLAVEGKLAEAIPLLQVRIGASPSGRQRFRARLDLARVCIQAGEAALARSLYEHLDQEMTARGLEEWEPALAAECLGGHLETLRLAAKDGKPVPAEATILYTRLCRVDPLSALRVGP